MKLSKDQIEAMQVGEQIFNHRQIFNESELSDLRIETVNNNMKLEDEQEQLADIKKEFKAKMNVIKSEIKDTMKKLRRGFVEEDRMCYLVPDHDNGVMNIYDKLTGELLDFRKLRPEEKQLSIHSINVAK